MAIMASPVVAREPGLSLLESNAVAPQTMERDRRALGDVEPYPGSCRKAAPRAPGRDPPACSRCPLPWTLVAAMVVLWQQVNPWWLRESLSAVSRAFDLKR